MRDRRWTWGLSLALAATSASCTIIAQPIAPSTLAAPAPEARLSTVRVKIDPEKKALAKLTKEQLAELGCKVVSDDEFFVENTPASLEKFKAA